MKRICLIGIVALSLSACSGAGDRTYDKPTITDSASYQTPADTQRNTNNNTPTTNNNAYNTDSGTVTNGMDTSSKHTEGQKNKRQ